MVSIFKFVKIFKSPSLIIIWVFYKEKWTCSFYKIISAKIWQAYEVRIFEWNEKDLHKLGANLVFDLNKLTSEPKIYVNKSTNE